VDEAGLEILDRQPKEMKTARCAEDRIAYTPRNTEAGAAVPADNLTATVPTLLL
jgi:hypothetical protein